MVELLSSESDDLKTFEKIQSDAKTKDSAQKGKNSSRQKKQILLHLKIKIGNICS